ncbi:MAG: hypothetical protein ACYTXC_20925 [Nostoc sp.]
MTEAIANELEGTGVSVTALCPSPVAIPTRETRSPTSLRSRGSADCNSHHSLITNYELR